MSRTTSSASSVTWSSSRSSAATVPSGMRVSRTQSSRPLQYCDPDQDHREVAHLAGLDEGQCLEQLVHRAEAAGQDHERIGVLDEHHLAREEVAEIDAQVHVRVLPLLVGQLDVAADRQPTALATAPVGGLHDARPAAGDDRVARLGQPAPDGPRQLVLGAVDRGAGRAEHGDRRAHCRHRIEPLDELGEDAQRPPRVGPLECGRGGPLQELLVLGGRVPCDARGGLGADAQSTGTPALGGLDGVGHAARMTPRRRTRDRWLLSARRVHPARPSAGAAIPRRPRPPRWSAPRPPGRRGAGPGGAAQAQGQPPGPSRRASARHPPGPPAQVR